MGDFAEAAAGVETACAGIGIEGVEADGIGWPVTGVGDCFYSSNWRPIPWRCNLGRTAMPVR